MNVALLIIFVFLAFAIYLGIRARRGRDMDLEQWSVGGRGFGTIFVFLLLAGEVFTTLTFLGASGWAYGQGGPAVFLLCGGPLAYAVGYWLLPPVWRYAKENRLHSQADFFASKYRSPGLGVLVSLVGVVAMVPYLAVQFKGLGIIVSETSYGSISSTMAIVVGVAALTAYVITSGIRGSAWTAALKDILALAVIVFLGLYLPFALHGGIGEMFRAINTERPGFLSLPSEGLSVPWFVSTLLMVALSSFLWPHIFGSTFSARNARTLRRNAIFMPLYQLILLFALFVGFAAILSLPTLEGSEADLALLRVSLQQFDPWVVGLIGAAGLLSALVPGSMLLMVSATVLSKNVYGALRPDASEETVGRLAKFLVPVVALAALVFTLTNVLDLVLLAVLGISYVAQLVPALLFSLMRNNFANKWGAGAGILVGVAIVTYLTVTGLTLRAIFPSLGSLGDINVGVIALLANVVVVVAISLATRTSTPIDRTGAPPDPTPGAVPQGRS
jgi:SSS family solute:Na+ symporter